MELESPGTCFALPTPNLEEASVQRELRAPSTRAPAQPRLQTQGAGEPLSGCSRGRMLMQCDFLQALLSQPESERAMWEEMPFKKINKGTK